MRFELSSISSHQYLYSGPLNGLKLQDRWDVGTVNVTGRFLLNPQDGPFHAETPQAGTHVGLTFNQSQSGDYGKKALNKVFISPKIKAGFKLTDVYSGQFQAYVKPTAPGYFATRGYITVIDANGKFKAKVGEFVGNALYAQGAAVNRSVPINYVDTAYTFAEGDRIVLEVGVDNLNSSPGTYEAAQKFGKSYTGDLGINNTDATEKNPWFGFSDALNFTL